MKSFYFTPFGTKQLQTASGAGGEALPNRTLIGTAGGLNHACLQVDRSGLGFGFGLQRRVTWGIGARRAIVRNFYYS